MLSQPKIENFVNVSTHTIVFIINAHSILKSFSVDLCASFKQLLRMQYYFWDLEMGKRWRNADPAQSC